MFSNIIGQNNVIKLLKNDFLKKSLNNSMIFYGKKALGKLTTALEFTRVLNCDHEGMSSCQCSHCIQIRNLDFSGLIFLSRRNFYFYIKEYFSTYIKNKNRQTYEIIKKYVKLTFLPLQDFLVKNCLSTVDKNQISEYSEKIQKIFAKEELSSVDEEDVLKIIKSINDIYKTPSIPINMLRDTLDWTYYTQPGNNRVVIIDQADLLEHSSKNILLKRLEEPSSDLFFILIAENKNRILQTIRSRCRGYFFNRQKKDEVSEILSINFKEHSVYKSVEDFLNRNDENYSENIHPLVIKLINLTFIKEQPYSELSIVLNGINDRKRAKAILDNFSLTIERELLERKPITKSIQR